MTWASLHPLFLFSWWAMKPMWLVRWILLLPPRARLGRKITRMPDNHSRATVFSSCTPLFSFPPWWRQPPRPHDSAANSTPAGFTVHLAPLHVLLSSPSRNADLFTTWAHSHNPIVAAVCISRLLTGGKRSGGSVARWWQQTPKWQQSRVLLGFRCSHYRLNNSRYAARWFCCVFIYMSLTNQENSPRVSLHHFTTTPQHPQTEQPLSCNWSDRPSHLLLKSAWT